MKIDLGVRGSEDAINHILLRVNNDFILYSCWAYSSVVLKKNKLQNDSLFINFDKSPYTLYSCN